MLVRFDAHNASKPGHVKAKGHSAAAGKQINAGWCHMYNLPRLPRDVQDISHSTLQAVGAGRGRGAVHPAGANAAIALTLSSLGVPLVPNR